MPEPWTEEEARWVVQRAATLAKAGAEPVASLLADRLQADASIRDTHTAAAVTQPYVDIDASTLFARIDAVTDGVLDQRQQCHRRASQPRRCLIHVQRESQAVRNAHLHQLQVSAHQIDLLPQCRRRLVHS